MSGLGMSPKAIAPNLNVACPPMCAGAYAKRDCLIAIAREYAPYVPMDDEYGQESRPPTKHKGKGNKKKHRATSNERTLSESSATRVYGEPAETRNQPMEVSSPSAPKEPAPIVMPETPSLPSAPRHDPAQPGEPSCLRKVTKKKSQQGTRFDFGGVDQAMTKVAELHSSTTNERFRVDITTVNCRVANCEQNLQSLTQDVAAGKSSVNTLENTTTEHGTLVQMMLES